MARTFSDMAGTKARTGKTVTSDTNPIKAAAKKKQARALNIADEAFDKKAGGSKTIPKPLQPSVRQKRAQADKTMSKAETRINAKRKAYSIKSTNTDIRKNRDTQ